MSRQLEAEGERRASAKRDALVKALEFGIVAALEAEGIELEGFAFKYDAWNCLMTIKASWGDKRHIAFVGSDTIINCILKAYSDARNGRLSWREDKYQASGT